MAIVLDKSHRWRVFAAHAFLVALVCLVTFPFLMIL
ncbi:maltose ABC transporter permease MalG, partial [Vibrio parahaemolyticus]|nr:maltose ABC transporter permease MalG [Vibrio parahaemolyticus]